MNFLVDTHAFIWFLTDDKNLPQSLKEILEDSSNECFLSIASCWEIGIKYSLGKLDLNTSLSHIFELIEESGFILLPITPQHIITNSTLSFHHRDPFDRMIIAQAKVEDMVLMSNDGKFTNYDINLLW